MQCGQILQKSWQGAETPPLSGNARILDLQPTPNVPTNHCLLFHMSFLHIVKDGCMIDWLVGSRTKDNLLKCRGS